MKCLSIHFPEAQTPVAVVLGSALTKAKTNTASEFIYVHFELTTEELTEACRRRLEGWGVSCLEPGEQYCAYGVVENDPDLFAIFRSDPEILEVELQEPSCGK